MKSRLAWLIALASAILGFGASQPQANEPTSSFPTRPVQITIPFAAGGSSDTVMRMLAQIVSKEWSQPIVIDNRVGATGAIAGEYVVRQPADGYTLLNAAPTSHTALRALRRDLPYDPMVDLVPVTLLAVAPMMMVVNPKKVPVNTVKELIDYVKANPGKLSYASTGVGSVAHLSVELFKILTATDMVHIPMCSGLVGYDWAETSPGAMPATSDATSTTSASRRIGVIQLLPFLFWTLFV